MAVLLPALFVPILWVETLGFRFGAVVEPRAGGRRGSGKGVFLWVGL